MVLLLKDARGSCYVCNDTIEKATVQGAQDGRDLLLSQGDADGHGLFFASARGMATQFWFQWEGTSLPLMSKYCSKILPTARPSASRADRRRAKVLGRDAVPSG